LEGIYDDCYGQQVELLPEDLCMGFLLKEEIANLLLVDVEEEDEKGGDDNEELDGPHSLSAVLLILVLLYVKTDLDECALLDADVE
jgi:hypothetical protein